MECARVFALRARFGDLRHWTEFHRARLDTRVPRMTNTVCGRYLREGEQGWTQRATAAIAQRAQASNRGPPTDSSKHLRARELGEGDVVATRRSRQILGRRRCVRARAAWGETVPPAGSRATGRTCRADSRHVRHQMSATAKAAHYVVAPD